MIVRLVLGFAMACAAFPAAAGALLPYDIDNFFRTPAMNPQLDYRLEAMLYDRVPDHIALGYRLEGLTGAVASHRNGIDAGPLDYDIKDLLGGYYSEADGMSACVLTTRSAPTASN